jgi:hypothetical protein
MGATKLLTAGGGGVTLDAASTATDKTVTIPARTGNMAIDGPAFSAYPSSNQSVTLNTFTKVLFQTEQFDTNNNFESSRFTPTIAGYYQINSSVYTNANASRILISIYKNGSEITRPFDVTATTVIGGSASQLLYLNGSTDYVEIYVYFGASVSISGTIYTVFNGFLARAA